MVTNLSSSLAATLSTIQTNNNIHATYSNNNAEKNSTVKLLVLNPHKDDKSAKRHDKIRCDRNLSLCCVYVTR
jgi:hypothetical protein